MNSLYGVIMNKSKSMGYLFVLLAILLIAVFVFFSAGYANGMLNAIIDFLGKIGLSNFQECGILVPSELTKLKTDMNTMILPFLYFGLPLLLLVLSVLMFLAGFYYHKGQVDEQSKVEDQLKRAVIHRLVKKMETGKK
ncbi:Uncharacterised protein [Candidatus Bilamarchaeum dharawalense]|uniref:Uncharacterized protein n=1 Tax=Candidatus Bilamarchaeum dharawalense TaxID=2885759 RepID=A0A5E4LQ08_9ARCH|nr:Uncharacterised protein [Candidatus Bilamarchaeum dharawalense]